MTLKKFLFKSIFSLLSLHFFTSCIIIGAVNYGLKIRAKDKIVSSKDVSSIPFTETKNLVLIDGILNNKKGKFVFDSGAFGIADSTFTSDISDKRKYESLKGEEGRIDYDEVMSYNLHKFNTLQLGDLSIKNPWMGELFMDALPEHACYFDAGILGLNFFKKHYVQLDFDQHEMVLSKDKNKLNNFTAYQDMSNSLDNVQGATFIKLSVNNNTYLLLLDFGFTGGIILFQKSIDSLANFGQFERESKGIPIQSADGTMKKGFPATHYYDLDADIQFFGYQFEYPITIISNGDHRARLPHDGLIGVDFLKHLNPVFDLVDGKIWLQVAEKNMDKLKEQTKPKGTYSLTSFRQHSLSLFHLPSALFDSLGLTEEEDMKIKRFNGKLVNQLMGNERCDVHFMTDLKALETDSIFIELENGKKLRLSRTEVEFD